MPVRLAESAGFCFGVNNAVNQVYRLLDEGEKVCTLGPIIHNPQVVDKLAAKGVTIVSDPAEVPRDSVLVVRSHGVPQSTYRQIEVLGVRCCDATCPFVAKIHKIVDEHSAAGAVVLIAGYILLQQLVVKKKIAAATAAPAAEAEPAAIEE